MQEPVDIRTCDICGTVLEEGADDCGWECPYCEFMICTLCLATDDPNDRLGDKDPCPSCGKKA